MQCHFRTSGVIALHNVLPVIALNNSCFFCMCRVPIPADVRAHGWPQLHAPYSPKQQLFLYVPGQLRGSGHMAIPITLPLFALNKASHFFYVLCPPADVRVHGLPQLPAPWSLKQQLLLYVPGHDMKSGVMALQKFIPHLALNNRGFRLYLSCPLRTSAVITHHNDVPLVALNKCCFFFRCRVSSGRHGSWLFPTSRPLLF